MRRLTGRNKEGNSYYKKCFEEPCLGDMLEDCTKCEYEDKFCERLAQYEDTGLMPEEIVELNDFTKSQCYKLLEKISELEKEIEGLSEGKK